jgi:putative membrane protein
MTARHIIRLTAFAICAAFVGACHFHSRAWLDAHNKDIAPDVSAHADTQPIVRQTGEPVAAVSAPAPSGKESKAIKAARELAAANDGRTVGMFLMENDIELSFARIAFTNASSDEVKAFARRMVTDHTQMIAGTHTMAAAADLDPADDMSARDLRDASTLQRDSLRALTGHLFDSTYVEMELQRHREMLSIIDDVLLPRARNAQLRDMLALMRPIVSAHIAHAQQLRASLAKH